MAPESPTVIPDPDVGEVLSHYRLQEKIGQGGMGVVWKAEDTLLGRTVAVKLLRPGLGRDRRRREMFLEEARLASSVSARHVAHVYDFVREGPRDFIVMEYVPGEPLSRIVKRGPLPPATVARWGAQTARGLAQAHDRGLLHRDIKPANILITSEDEVKLVDFGVAALRPSPEPPPDSDELISSRAETLTSDRLGEEGRALVGTIPYMSPEHLRGEDFEARSDVFSLGAVLYEMTTGKQAFTGKTSMELAASILTARPRPPHEIVPEVPDDLERILDRALSPDPGDRHASMEELAEDLERLGHELEAGTARPRLVVPPSRSGVRLRRFGIPAVAIVVVLLLLALGSWLRVLLSPAEPVVDERTILVFPMEVRGQAEGAEYAGNAFAEAVAVQLAQYRDLRILPVPSADEFGEAVSGDRARSARERGAGVFLSGSITRGPEAVQASVTIVDAQENRILWGIQSEDPDGDLNRLAGAVVREGILRLGSRASPSSASPVELSMGSALAASPETTVATDSLRRNAIPEALKATQQLLLDHPEDKDALMLRTTALLRQWCVVSTPESRRELQEALQRLKRFDPQNLYGGIELDGPPGGPSEAEEILTEQLRRESLPLAYRAEFLRDRGWARKNLGDYPGALEDLRNAIELEPADPWNLSTLAYVLQESGQAEDALAHARNAAALNPSEWFFHHTVGMVLADLDRFDGADQAFADACRQGATQQPCTARAIVLLASGKRTLALAAIREAEAMPPTVYGTYNLACFWALAGDNEAALRHLRQSVGLGLSSEWLMRDPDLQSLREDPGFEELVAEVLQRL